MQIYADFMKNYAEFMHVYADFMQNLCRIYAGLCNLCNFFMQFYAILCRFYADFMHFIRVYKMHKYAFYAPGTLLMPVVTGTDSAGPAASAPGGPPQPQAAQAEFTTAS